MSSMPWPVRGLKTSANRKRPLAERQLPGIDAAKLSSETCSAFGGIALFRGWLHEC